MFVVRPSQVEDITKVHRLAQHLNTVNLPKDYDRIVDILETSRKAFMEEEEPLKRMYCFVLEEIETGHIVGVSMIYAQHGTRQLPHIAFEVLEEERYSTTLDTYIRNQCLRLRYDYDGPTEIGGLVLDPQYRGNQQALGKLICLVRFVFIAIYRQCFRDHVLAELLPPFEEPRVSRFWKHLGKQFTQLTYDEADALSAGNKEFIRALFPQGLIYVCLFPKEVQEEIGQVGESVLGVQHMLTKTGFTYAKQVDPFDGGPHYTAITNDITTIKSCQKAIVTLDEHTKEVHLEEKDAKRYIVGTENDKKPQYFRATSLILSKNDGDTTLPLSADIMKALDVTLGDVVWYASV